MDKKFWFQLIGLAVVILGATYLAFNNRYLTPFTNKFNAKTPSTVKTQTNTRTLQIIDSNNNVKAQINVEIADSAEKRTKGLGYRESLASDSGMLFIHDKTQKYTYWMKGMKFPLDIMWVLDDKILDIIQKVPPPITGQTDETLERYASTADVNRVLEVNSGFVIAEGIQIGDKIVLKPN